MRAHCLFEQSGTFKNAFIKNGIEAFDYDISNKFGNTDYVVNLFNEIDLAAYTNCHTIFDNIYHSDIIFAFYPCIRFEDQSLLLFRCDNAGMKDFDISRKIDLDLNLMDELQGLYKRLLLLINICVEKQLQLIIENPYSSQHFLLRYSFLKPTWVDFDRRLRGDYFKKPTMYFFFNRSIKNNFVTDPLVMHDTDIKVVNARGINRSIISPEYADRFIKEFIL